MILYIDADGEYVAKQDEAKRAGKGWHQVEVPTTDGRQALADYLNAVRWSEHQVAAEDREMTIEQAREHTDVEEMLDPTGKEREQHQTAVARAMAQCDVEEAIQAAELPALASYASNVAWRYNELAKGSK